MRPNPKNPGAEKNLIRFGIERSASEAGKKGGASKSLKKRWALQLNGMRQRGAKDEMLAWFVERLKDPETSIFHMQSLIDKVIEKNPTDHVMISAIQALLQLHKANFGEKTFNTNLNVNTDIDEWERRLLKLKKKDDGTGSNQ